MPSPVAPYKPSEPISLVIAAVDLATTGVKQTYTVPAGRRAKFIGASQSLTGGVAPIIALQLIVGGVTVQMQRLTAQGAIVVPAWLAAADVVRWNVIVLGAAGVGDLTITVEEFVAL